MKTITLHTASIGNDGRRIAAGAAVGVGTKPDQIDADRARVLLAAGCAAEDRPAKAQPGDEPAAD